MAGPIFAEWVREKLYVACGEELAFCNFGYGTVPSHFRILGVERGRITSDLVVENKNKTCFGPQEDTKQLIARDRSGLARLIQLFRR